MRKINWDSAMRTVHTQEHVAVLTQDRPDPVYPVVCMIGARVRFYTIDGIDVSGLLPVENVPVRLQTFRNLYDTGRVGAAFSTLEAAIGATNEGPMEHCTGQLELLLLNGEPVKASIHARPEL